MKNWEFYEGELRTYGINFAIEDNQMCSCAFVSCDRCMFSMSESCPCDATRVKWLYQEYKEPVVLTDDEKALCKLLGRGWIARDKNDYLHCGHIADIGDLVTFEAGTLDELEKQFRLAVDDYIEFCKEVGKNGI